MRTDTIYREDTMSVCKHLSDYAQINPEPGEPETAYAERLAVAVNRRLNELPEKAADKVWFSWPKASQDWMNTIIRLIQHNRDHSDAPLPLPVLEGFEPPMEAVEQEIPSAPGRLAMAEGEISEANEELAKELQTPSPQERPPAHNLRARRRPRQHVVGRADTVPPVKKPIKGKVQKISKPKAKIKAPPVSATPYKELAPPVFLPGLTGEEISFVKALYKALGSLLAGPEVVHAPSDMASIARDNGSGRPWKTTRKPVKGKKAKTGRVTNPTGRSSWGENAIVKILVPPDASRLLEGSSADATYQALLKFNGAPWSRAAMGGADHRQAWLLRKRGYVHIQ